MNELKRKWDVVRCNIETGSASENDEDLKSPGSDSSYESSKRRRMDLETSIFDLGYTGSKEELDKLSNRQKKKLVKRLKWAKVRPIRRQLEREKKRLKMVQNKLNGVKIISRKAKKLNSMANSDCKLSVVIDLSFDDLMSHKDIHKCIQQINRCYCANRSCEDPLQFYVTRLDGKAKEVLAKYNGYENWDIKFSEKSYLEIFDNDRLVYLTSDSDNIVDDLDENKVYIIGGLVDHNAHKNLCYRIACDQGIAHGRLPIDNYLEMKSRKVLAINHVFEIMLYVASGGLSWKDAFLKVIPQRKNFQPKSDDCCEKYKELSNYVNEKNDFPTENTEEAFDYDSCVNEHNCAELLTTTGTVQDS